MPQAPTADAGAIVFALVCFAGHPLTYTPITALLSAARAFASLKMGQDAALNAAAAATTDQVAASTSSDSGPSRAGNMTPTPGKKPDDCRRGFVYTRRILLKLYDSPLCRCPEGMKPLKEWFG